MSINEESTMESKKNSIAGTELLRIKNEEERQRMQTAAAAEAETSLILSKNISTEYSPSYTEFLKSHSAAAAEVPPSAPAATVSHVHSSKTEIDDST